MPRCYIFASIAADDQKLVFKMRAEVKELALSKMQKVNLGRARTANHLCAELDGKDGAYQFLLRFDFVQLSDVASAVLENRKLFKRQLRRTLTIIEYPDRNSVPPRGSLGQIENALPRGILLIQENVGANAFTTANAVRNVVEDVIGPSTVLECKDVFGPVDYVVEFRADSASDVKIVEKMLDLNPTFKEKASKWTCMHCEPYRFSNNLLSVQLSFPFLP